MDEVRSEGDPLTQPVIGDTHYDMISRLRVLLLALAAVAFAIWPETLAAAPFALLGATTEITDLSMDAAMKIYFTDPIVRNFVTDTELMDLFEEDNKVQVEQTTGGRYIETAQYFVLPGAVGSRSPGDYIPVPEGPVIRNSRIYLKKHFGVIQMTGDVMERVQGDMGAYLDYMDTAMPDLLERFNDNFDRQLLGYGNGARAQIELINGTTITLKNSLGVIGWSNPWLMVQDNERLVASVDLDGDPLRNPGAGQSAKIVDIDPDLNTIEVDAVPGAWANDDYLFGGDASGTSAQNAGEDREVTGLAGLIDDGSILATFQGLARADYRLWRSHVVDGASGSFSGDLDEVVLVSADNRAAVRGKGKPNIIVTSREQADRYWLSLRGDRQLINPKAYEGGRSGVSVRLGDRVIPIRVSRKMPTELAYMIQTDTLKRWQLDGGKWDDKTGSVWNRVTDGTGRKDDFYAVYIWYTQMGNLAPAKSVRIQNLVGAGV